MGKEVVAAYTQVDKDLLHLNYADEVICIGKQSYLTPDNLIMAARVTNCDGVHPGYGLLSEDADFAELVTENDLTFIGPTADQIRQLGDKSAARDLLATCGLRPIPGSEGAIESVNEALSCAKEIGYPLVIKASFGGGGRGIRLIHQESELRAAFQEAKSEADSNFGRDELYIEKYLPNARHVEVQLMGDGQGSAVHLGTRDCSVQRRHQKIVEEAPAPGIDKGKLDLLARKSADAFASLKYQNAATLEFLYQDGEFYFMEANTRLQVEHPVSEMIAGVDLVQAQLLVTDSGQLPWTQEEIQLQGHSIECRINAEDEAFRPSPGLVVRYEVPGGNGVRVDSHLYAGYEVPHQYDSLIAKLITHGSTRDEAMMRMKRALKELRIEGIETGMPLLDKILDDQNFRQAVHTTQLMKHVVS